MTFVADCSEFIVCYLADTSQLRSCFGLTDVLKDTYQQILVQLVQHRGLTGNFKITWYAVRRCHTTCSNGKSRQSDAIHTAQGPNYYLA